MSAQQERSAQVVTQPQFELIDSDVHPYSREGFASTYDYMPRQWRQRFTSKDPLGKAGSGKRSMRFSKPGEGLRRDATPPGGGPIGSDPSFLVTDHLERYGIDAVVLHPFEPGPLTSCLTTPDESNIVATAFNEYFINEWLPVDSRFWLVIHVSPQDPLEAAKEIRRAGRNAHVVGVALAPINILLGNRHFHPIYEAAQELGLPIFYHPAANHYEWQGTPVPCGGFPETYLEWKGTMPHAAEASVNSLVCTGTLERFPELKFVFAEWGFTWMLSYIWRADTYWKANRIDSPWIRKPPREYIREHVRLTTQPLDDVEDPRQLDALIGMLDPELLLFSSDYPHYDADNPGQGLKSLSSGLKRRINALNAMSVFPFQGRHLG